MVAKDRGDPPASSETVLIVNVLDVNDNDPEFPTRVSGPVKFWEFYDKRSLCRCACVLGCPERLQE